MGMRKIWQGKVGGVLGVARMESTVPKVAKEEGQSGWGA